MAFNSELKKKFSQTSLIFLCACLCLLSVNAAADHGKETWITAQESIVVVNPTWQGYAKPGFGAPPGTAPAGAGFYYSVDNGETSPFIITAAHVVKKAKSIEIINFSGEKAQAFLHALDEQRDIADALLNDLRNSGDPTLRTLTRPQRRSPLAIIEYHP